MNKAKPILIVLFSIVVVIVAGFFTLGLLQKAKYDAVRERLDQELGKGLAPVTLNESKLEEVSQWYVHSSDVGDASVHADALKSLGKKPTVKNVVELFKIKMQPYAWLDWQRNRQNLNTAAVQATFAPITIDGSIHVSADGSTAIIFVRDGIVFVFKDTPEGLLDEIRYRDPPESP